MFFLAALLAASTSYAQVCDGITDDTAALQALVTAADLAGGGTVHLPVGQCKITSTLVIAPSSNFKSVNLVGEGSLASRIWWAGPTDGVAIRVNGIKQYLFEGWVLDNKVARGTTTGVLMQRDSGTGTQTGNAVWRNVQVRGFSTGIQVGNVGISQAGSEIHFDHLILDSNDVGCQISDWNSLNFLFTMLELGANGTGLRAMEGNTIAVLGGSGSYQSVADFDFRPGGTFRIDSFRSEHANRFLIGGNTSAGTPITVTGSLVIAPANPDGYVIDVGSGPLVLIGNILLGKVGWHAGSWCSISMSGNAVADTDPFRTLGGGTGGHYVQLGNRQVDSNNFSVGHFSDEMGSITAGIRTPWLRAVAP